MKEKRLLFIACLFITFSVAGSYQYRTLDEVFKLYGVEWSEGEQKQFARYFDQYDSLIESDGIQALQIARAGLVDNKLSIANHVFRYLEIKALSALGQFDSALMKFEALPISTVPVNSFAGDCFLLKGRLTKLNGDYALAMKYYEQALVFFKELNDFKGTAITQINLIEYYRSIGNFETALNWIHTCGQLIKTNQISGEVYLYYLNRVSAVYNESGQLEKAYETALKTIDLLNETDNVFLLANAYNELASISNQLEKTDSVEYYLNRAIELWKRGGHARFWVSAVGNLVSYKMENQQWDEIEPLIEEALLVTKNHGWHAILYTLYLHKATLYEKRGDLRKAISYLDSSHQSNIRDLRQSVNKEVAVKAASFELERQQLQTKLAKIEAEKIADERNMYFIATLSLGLGFLGFITFSLSLRRKSMEIQNVNRELFKALKLKEVLLKDLHHRVKNNLTFLISLIQLQKKRAKNEMVSVELDAVKERLEAMAVLHANLLEHYSEEEVLLSEVLEQIKFHISGVLGTDHQITLDVMDAVSISSDHALVLGVILNELFTNSIKHGSHSQVIEIRLKFQVETDHYVFYLSDNGKGLPNEEILYQGESVGFRLINLLVEQLGGKITYVDKSKEFILVFPNLSKK